MSKSSATVKLSAVDQFSPRLIDISAQFLAANDGKRWASLTGWQRDKYRRVVLRRLREQAPA